MEEKDKDHKKLDLSGPIGWKKAYVLAFGLCCMSWAALPLIAWLIYRKKNLAKK